MKTFHEWLKEKSEAYHTPLMDDPAWKDQAKRTNNLAMNLIYLLKTLGDTTQMAKEIERMPEEQQKYCRTYMQRVSDALSRLAGNPQSNWQPLTHQGEPEAWPLNHQVNRALYPDGPGYKESQGDRN